MRYSYEFKKKCVEMYKQGKYPDTPSGIRSKYFHNEIRNWVKIVEACGFEALKHKNHNKSWSPEERYDLVSRVLAGESIKSVAFSIGMDDSTLGRWVYKYKTLGYNGLVNIKRNQSCLDMNTNEIISYELSLHPTLNQVKRMLDKAIEKFPNVKGIILHSDQGWQYQHRDYREKLEEEGMIQSMSRKGNCYDNCIMETFFGRMKNEMYYGYEKENDSYEEITKEIEEYIDYYNNKRIQTKTKWMPPVKYREASTCLA